jgi:hypothetical protein
LGSSAVSASAPPALRWAANGWQVSGILRLRSGNPLSITTDRDNNLDGVNFDCGNLVGDPRLDPDRPRSATTAQWFNVAAFNASAKGGQEGTSGRNIFDGPGLRNLDAGIIRESIKPQIRIEMTSGLNLVSLVNPTTAMNNAAFGTIRSARTMRQIQLGLRLTF